MKKAIVLLSVLIFGGFFAHFTTAVRPTGSEKNSPAFAVALGTAVKTLEGLTAVTTTGAAVAEARGQAPLVRRGSALTIYAQETCDGFFTCGGGSTCDGSQSCTMPITSCGTCYSTPTCQGTSTCSGGWSCDGSQSCTMPITSCATCYSTETCQGHFTCDQTCASTCQGLPTCAPWTFCSQPTCDPNSYTCGWYTCGSGYTCGSSPTCGANTCGGYTCQGSQTCGGYTCGECGTPSAAEKTTWGRVKAKFKK